VKPENPAGDKLLEAQYFLKQMKLVYQDDDEFRYNLSAFLSAIRSVTWHMQKQYERVQKFKRWYEAKRSEMKSDTELKLFPVSLIRTGLA
jgi:hypothetical protein